MVLATLVALSPLTLLLTLPILAFLTHAIYQLFFHPLRLVPGPFLCKFNNLWLFYHSYIGDECSQITRLHSIYGSVVRIGPYEISISDGAALAPIYTEGGGFMKSACYTNFDIEGHASIFSALDPAYRAIRAKPVVSLFASSAIRNKAQETLDEVSKRMAEKIKSARDSDKEINVLDVTRAAAVDAVSGYLFGENYEGLGEKRTNEDSVRRIESERLSASGFVDTFVAVGRFFLLPNFVFLFLESIIPKLFPNPDVDKSMAAVSTYVDGVVSGDKSSPTHGTYQNRLLRAGISAHETGAQCMDLIFAGTDSTGMNLATAFFQLARHPGKHSRLHQELLDAPATADPQTLPYLRAVIRESLRISMANPTRLPRVVPSGGWSFVGYMFPRGTNVGCALHTLHFNPAVYAAPFEFRPERWLDDTEDNKVTPEMNRDHIPFGLGTRSCIAKNLAMAELYAGVSKVVLSGVLYGASTDVETIEIDEWFNSKVKGGKVMLRWR